MAIRNLTIQERRSAFALRDDDNDPGIITREPRKHTKWDVHAWKEPPPYIIIERTIDDICRDLAAGRRPKFFETVWNDWGVDECR